MTSQLDTEAVQRGGADIFIVTTIGDIPFLKYVENAGNRLIVCVDSAIAFAAREKGYASLSPEELLSLDTWSALTKQAYATINEKIICFDGGKELFQALRYEALFCIRDVLLLKCRVAALLKQLRPSRVSLFCGDRLRDLVVIEILKSENLEYEKVVKPDEHRLRLQAYVERKLPFIGWERKYYPMLWNQLSHNSVWRRSKTTKAASVQSQQVDIIVGPIYFREDLFETLQLLDNRRDQKILVLAHPRLYELDLEPLRQRKIPYIFIDLVTVKTKDHHANLAEIIESRLELIHLLKVFVEEPVAQLIAKKLASDEQMEELSKLKSELSTILSILKPKEVFLTYFFSALSRICFREYRSASIPSRALVTSFEQYVLGIRDNRLKLTDAEADPFLPDRLILSHRSLAEATCELLPSKNQVDIAIEPSEKVVDVLRLRPRVERHDETLEKICRELGLKSRARLIVFTTQQHHYSHIYIRLLIKAFVETVKHLTPEERDDWYLIIKVHPKEFLWPYALTLGRLDLSNVNVRLTKDVDVYDLIMASDLLITYFSFTAIEALALGTCVLRLSFEGRDYFPEFPHTVELDSVQTFAALENALAKTTIEKRGRKQGFSRTVKAEQFCREYLE